MSSRWTLDTSVQAQAAILEQMHCSVIATDPEGTIIYWNRFAEQQFQWDSSEAVGRFYADVVLPPEGRAGALEALRIIRESGHLEIDATCLRRDGSTFDAHTVCTALRSSDGEIIGQIGVTNDVSKERTVERELRASEERFRSLAEGAPLMIWMTDPSGRLEYVNSRVQETTGLSHDEVLGESWFETIHPDDREETREVYSRALAEHRELRHEYRMRDTTTDSYRWVLGTSVPRASADGEFAGMVGYGLDITERRQQQEARAQSAEITSSLAQVGQQLISSLHSPNFLDKLCALCAEHLDCESGYTLLLRDEEEAFELIAGTWPTQEERDASLGLKVPAEMMSVLVDRLRDEDVSAVGTIPAEFLAQKPDLAEAGRICIALRQGDDLIGIQTVQRPSLAAFSEAQLAVARGIGQLASLALDHARLVEELERASSVKSDFVATMSHELRTPLHVILGYTDLLLTGEFGPLSSEQADTARRIDRRARELHDLITNTLDVSRLDSGRVRLHIEDVSLSHLLAEIDLETQRQQEDVDIRLDISVPEDLRPVRSDPMKLKVVVKNLVSNALKFTPGGTVGVSGRADAEGVEITVRDTGIGIAQDQLGAIFEPFQQVDGSASRRHGGAGLGLYIVRRLVDLLGGSITVESEPGNGTTFRIWLADPSELAAEARPVS